MGSLTKLLIVVGLLSFTFVVLYMNNTAQPDEAMPETVMTAHTVGEFTNLVPFTIGRISMLGSIADTDAERALGLSYTTELPIGVAKVFIFDSAQPWSFWMKDMNYSIDIFWLDANGTVVHVVENASPETYPEISFVPPVPAKYVIETRAGFAAENNIGVGASVNIAPLERTRQ
jgi:uncharacterized protein